MFLELLILVIISGLILWALLKWIGSRPALLTDVGACRGNWAEARIRGCDQGISHTGIPVEPVNVFSNLAYLAAGWMVFRVVHDPPSWVFAGAMAFLCVGSALYHGLKTMWASRLDHAGMYAVFASLAFYGMAPGHPVIVYIMAGVAVLAAVAFAFVFPGNLMMRMGLLLALMSVRAFLLGSPWAGGLSLGLFLLGMIAWLLDRNTLILGRLGHGVWHLFTAAAIAAMFIAMS